MRSLFLLALVAGPALAQTGPVDVSFAALGDGLAFVENRGQWPDEVLFCARTGGATAWVTSDGVTFDFYEVERATNDGEAPRPERPDVVPEAARRRGHVVRMRFEGGDARRAVGHRRRATYHNYFLGSDPSKWASRVPLYDEVMLEGLYDGVDLRLYADGGLLRYDLVLAPGADGSQIRMLLEGAGGVAVTEAGGLTFETALGPVEHRGLLAYHEGVEGQREAVPSAFVVEADGAVSLAVTGVDPSRRVVIEQLIWATFLGGAGSDQAEAVAVEADGSAVVAGHTTSTGFPTTLGAYDTDYNAGFRDAFVSRLSADGSDLLYSTYLGGTRADDAYAVALGADGSIFIAGGTTSSDFPTTPGAFDTSHNDGATINGDAFVTRLAADGASLLYSTFLGGVGVDTAYGFAVAPAGEAVIAGRTSSSGFPTTPGAFDTSHNGDYDAFVAQLSPDGSALLYSTFLGGAATELVRDLVLGADGEPLVVGRTASSDFPTTPGAFDTSYNGNDDAFAAKLSADGSALLYGTFLGGTNADDAHGVAVDAGGAAIVVGTTRSSDFPATPGAFDTSYNGGYPVGDAFVARLSADGSELHYGTFLGGSNDDVARAVTLDPDENAVLVGGTHSYNFPVTLGAFDTSHPWSSRAVFATKLSADGSTLLYGTYIGSSNEEAYDVDLDEEGIAIIVGHASSSFPVTPGAYDTTFNFGGSDAFIARLTFNLLPFVFSAAPLNSPVPRHQLLRFRATLTTNVPPFTGDVVLDVEGQGGFSASHTLLQGVAFSTGETVVREFELRVPPQFPLGPATATLTVLEGGTNPVTEAEFAFEVLPTLPALALAAEALNSPVPRGDALHFRVTLTNNTPGPFHGDLALDVESQGGVVASRTLVTGATLPPWQTAAPTFALRVPHAAPLGLYTGTVTALEGGTTPLAEASLAFRVVPAEARADGAGAAGTPWTVVVLDGGGLDGPLAMAEVAAPEGVAVWPNPASSGATLAFTLEGPSAVRLALYDVLGRAVLVRDAGRLEPGAHRLGLDLSLLPAGTYVWRLVADGHTEAGRLTVVR